ncbi:MAG TPA: DNA primase [Myxococcota bacterium]|nr:DNA primase [Myxococcota bacterium]
MARIPEETLQTIRDRTDLVDLVGRHVALKKAGRAYKGLCPFHHEKTPSFSVNPDRGIYHCFGCGESGNAFDFLIKIEGLTFPEAARALAAGCGVEILESGAGDGGLVERLLAANAAAQKFYQHALASDAGRGARDYLAGRGLDAESIARFGVGYAPPGWEELAAELRRAHIPAELGERAGLLRERASGGYYDLLRDRVTFPIQDARGRVVAFGGRALAADQEPKYLNSPETPVFRKREGFYGFPFALEAIRRSDRVVVSEGYFDRIALHRAGVEEAVATCGTALSEDHARALRRRARHVVLLFDGDAAGRRAALRALETLLPAGLRVRAAALPPGDDPDSLLAREGPEALRAVVERAGAALDLAIESATERGCATPEQRADAVAAVVPLLAKLADPTERTAWAQRLALAVGARELDVEATVRAAARSGGAAEPPAALAPRHGAPLESAGPEERHLGHLVQVLLQHPGAVSGLDPALLAEDAPSALWREIVAGVAAACAGRANGGEVLAALEPVLSPAALARVHALAADFGPVSEDAALASRALADIAAWFERRRRKARQRELTEALRASPPDESAQLLGRKVGIEATR